MKHFFAGEQGGDVREWTFLFYCTQSCRRRRRLRRRRVKWWRGNSCTPWTDARRLNDADLIVKVMLECHSRGCSLFFFFLSTFLVVEHRLSSSLSSSNKCTTYTWLSAAHICNSDCGNKKKKKTNAKRENLCLCTRKRKRKWIKG